MKYLVWIDEYPESEAKEIYGLSRSDAAEKYCRKHDADALEYPSERTVFVRDGLGDVTHWVVSMTPEPVYRANVFRVPKLNPKGSP